MTKLLQNKVAVAFLLATAVGMAAFQFNLFTGSGPLLVSGREADSEAPPEGDEGEGLSTTNSPPRYLTGLRDWPQMLISEPLRRDPFQPRPLQSGDLAAHAPLAPSRTNFRLQAISRHQERRFAVVDGGVFGEGDRIAEFRIILIDSHSVLLRGHDGTEKKLELHFDGATARPGQTTDEGSATDPSDPTEAEPR
ncbi:MAG: hypothetical protein JNN07_20565 [Verrucomicrobiales bacterium]|nr:hypothetical protein [Verrucomicrobiales bacterium]